MTTAMRKDLSLFLSQARSLSKDALVKRLEAFWGAHYDALEAIGFDASELIEYADSDFERIDIRDEEDFKEAILVTLENLSDEADLALDKGF